MRFLSAPWDALPDHRTEGLAASMTIHVAAFLFLTAIPQPPPERAGEGMGEGMLVTEVAAEVIGEAAGAGDAPPESLPVEELEAPTPPDQGNLVDLDGIAVDIGKIRRHRDRLFPFVTETLPLLAEPASRTESRPPVPNPFAGERTSATRPALTLSEGQIQTLVDRAWSRRSRWDSFREIAQLLRTHDPNRGDAARLVRAHVDQNLLQPYHDGATRDPRFWVMLGLAADHAPFIDFVAAYMHEHPSSRATTELLFMLDEFAQASRDTMLMLLSTNPQVLLYETRDADEDAFLLADSIYRQYRDLARAEGLVHTDAVRARFDEVRIGILRTIVETTPDGYGESDARYLLGLIHWDRRDIPGALQWWRNLGPDGRGAYEQAASAIARELSRPGGGTAAAISGILGGEYRRWLTFSQERLKRFGYAFHTF